MSQHSAIAKALHDPVCKAMLRHWHVLQHGVIMHDYSIMQQHAPVMNAMTKGSGVASSAREIACARAEIAWIRAAAEVQPGNLSGPSLFVLYQATGILWILSFTTAPTPNSFWSCTYRLQNPRLL
jgi:hypothetical protein